MAIILKFTGNNEVPRYEPWCNVVGALVPRVTRELLLLRCTHWTIRVRAL